MKTFFNLVLLKNKHHLSPSLSPNSIGGEGDRSVGLTDDLPPVRREKYDQSGRNSKVLVKKLTKA